MGAPKQDKVDIVVSTRLTQARYVLDDDDSLREAVVMRLSLSLDSLAEASERARLREFCSFKGEYQCISLSYSYFCINLQPPMTC